MMSHILWIGFELAATLFESFVCLYFTEEMVGRKFFGKKFYITFVIAWLMFAGLITASNYITEFEGLGVLGFSLVIFGYSLLCLRGSVPQKIITSLIPIFGVAIVNSLVILIFSNFTKDGFSDLVLDDNIYRFLAVVASKVLLYYFLLIIYKIFKKEKGIHYGKREWIPILCIFFISAVIFICIDLINMYNEINAFGRVVSMMAVLLLIILNVVALYMVGKINHANYVETENRLLRQKVGYQHQYVDQIKSQEKELKIIRHDLKNSLFILETKISQNNIDEANDFLHQFLQQDVLNSGNVNTDNAVINTLVNTKISYAKSLGIHCSVQCSKKIQKVNDLDICNLLGNVLDNAIEASSACTLKNKSIELSILCERDIMTITVKNTIDKSVLKHNEKLKTSKKDAEFHGYGIISVQKIVEKYNGRLDMFEKDNTFCLVAILCI